MRYSSTSPADFIYYMGIQDWMRYFIGHLKWSNDNSITAAASATATATSILSFLPRIWLAIVQAVLNIYIYMNDFNERSTDKWLKTPRPSTKFRMFGCTYFSAPIFCIFLVIFFSGNGLSCYTCVRMMMPLMRRGQMYVLIIKRIHLAFSLFCSSPLVPLPVHWKSDQFYCP